MFISNAYAAPPAAGGQDGSFFIMMIVIFILFYFMMIRPQSKRAKEQRSMLAALEKGDEVVTIGGQLGKITKVSDAYINLEIAAGVVIQVQKQAVQTLLPKGTIKSNS